MPTRRTVSRFALTGAATAWRPIAGQAQSQSATPSAESVPPGVILRRIQESPITTRLFPGDTGHLEIRPWDDRGDTDLEGVLGAVLVSDASLGDGDDAMIGAYIVHPSTASAEERMQAQLGDEPADAGWQVFGHRGGNTLSPDGYAAIALEIGPVIVSSFAHANGTRAVDAPNAYAAMALEARVLGNLAGLIDHLRLIQQAGQG